MTGPIRGATPGPTPAEGGIYGGHPTIRLWGAGTYYKASLAHPDPTRMLAAARRDADAINAAVQSILFGAGYERML